MRAESKSFSSRVCCLWVKGQREVGWGGVYRFKVGGGVGKKALPGRESELLYTRGLHSLKELHFKE